MKWWIPLSVLGGAAALWALHNAPEPAKPASATGPKPPPAPPAPSNASSKPATTVPPAASPPKGRVPSAASAAPPGAGLPPGFTPPPGASATRGLETIGKLGGPPGPSILDSLVPGAGAPVAGPGADVPAVVLPEKKDGKDGEVVTVSEATTGPTLADKLADAGMAALPSAWSGITPGGTPPSGTDGAP